MTALGLGIDIVDVHRVSRMLERNGDRVYSRFLTRVEREYCRLQVEPARHVAAHIAVKEAAYKALSQSGDAPVFWWRDVEVVRDSAGQPTVTFHGKAEAYVEHIGLVRTVVSLSHTERRAAAVVMVIPQRG